MGQSINFELVMTSANTAWNVSLGIFTFAVIVACQLHYHDDNTLLKNA